MFSHIAHKRLHALDQLAKELVVGDALGAHGIALGLPFVLVNIDEVNVARNIELAPPQFAHPNDPQLAGLAWPRRARLSIDVDKLATAEAQRAVQTPLRQLGHGQGDSL